MGNRYADHMTPLYPQKLALTSPTGGGCSVGIVRSRTKATEFSFSFIGFSSSLMDQLGYGNFYMGLAELAYFRWWFYVPKVKTAETRVSYYHIIISHSTGWKSNKWYLWWCCQTGSFHGPGWESSQEYIERRPATLNSTWKTTMGHRSQGDVQYVLLGKF